MLCGRVEVEVCKVWMYKFMVIWVVGATITVASVVRVIGKVKILSNSHSSIFIRFYWIKLVVR